MITLRSLIEAGKLVQRNFESSEAFSLELNSFEGEIMQRTYLTPSVRELIRSITGRHECGTGDSVYLLNSSFGSGKTHTLLSIKEVLGKDCDVITVDGHEIRSTLWGHLCELLGVDDTGATPATARNILGRNCVILLDELVVYLKRARAVRVGDTTLDQVTLAFLHTVFAFSRDYNSVLVLTLTDDQQAYSDETNALLRSLMDITYRQAWMVPPNSREDYKSILHMQIFSSSPGSVLSDPLIELLTFGLSSNPSYQGLRSALRILSKLDISAIHEGAIQVTPGDLPVENDLYDEFVARLGHERLGNAMREDILMNPEATPLIRCAYLSTISTGGISKRRLQEWLQDGRYTSSELHRLIDQSASLYISWQGEMLSYSADDSLLKRIVEESKQLDPSSHLRFARDEIKSLLSSPEFSLRIFDWSDGGQGRPVLMVPPQGKSAEKALLEVQERNNVFVLAAGDTSGLMKTLSLMHAARNMGAEDFHQLYSRRLVSEFVTAYPNILYYDSGKPKSLDIGLPMTSLGRHIHKLLFDRSVILDSLSPEHIDIGNGMTLDELYSNYCRNTLLRTVSSRMVLETTLKEGERLGMFERQGDVWVRSSVDEVQQSMTVKCAPSGVRKYLGYMLHGFEVSVTGTAGPSALAQCVNLLRLRDRDMVGNFSLTSQNGDARISMEMELVTVQEASQSLKSLRTKRIDQGSASLSLQDIGLVLDDDLVGMLRPLLQLANSVSLTISKN